MNKKTVYKIILLLLAGIFFGGVAFVLNHTVQNGRKTTVHLPVLTDMPVYVACEEGKELTVKLHTDKDFAVSGLQLFLVNLDETSRGTLTVTVADSEKNLMAQQVTPVGTITPGEWFLLPMELQLQGQSDYEITFLTDESEPYFMQVPDSSAASFPFSYQAYLDGQAVNADLSLGVNTVVAQRITFGDVFYYAWFFWWIALVITCLFIFAGKERICAWISKIPFGDVVQKYGNDFFLLLLFGCLCIGIIANAYVKGVYITSDSAGYLREATNLVAGEGFAYDGLAGYQSWFANWPILYPAMIALVMLVTHTNAYLASKLLTMLIIALLLLVLRLYFKKDAWVYALCLTNIGFVNLTYYTWSEIPFMLFMLCFGLVLAEILRREKPSARLYVFLGISGFLCFLTRYFGLYLWIVVGAYLLVLLLQYRQTKNKIIWKKGICLLGTACVSGMLSMAYLLVNRQRNGRVTGVSRGLWWDDYQILTNDLIETLLKEFFHIFSLQIPQVIDDLSYPLKVWFLLVLLLGLIWFVKRNCRPFTTESVLLTLGAFYYVIFIGIRYVSSMDTFYFRFFEPASFLISIGLFGLLLPYLRGKKAFGYLAGAVTAILVLVGAAYIGTDSLAVKNSYYENLTAAWDNAYKEIPDKSVVIFSDMDFRASYYRPDVVEGEIRPEDSLENIRQTYYGSEYLCIRAEYAKTMLEDGTYSESIQQALQKGLAECKGDVEYVRIKL